MPVILILGRLRQEGHLNFEACQGYIVNLRWRPASSTYQDPISKMGKYRTSVLGSVGKDTYHTSL